MKKKIFVSFIYRTAQDEQGIGNAEVEITNPVRNVDDVEQMSKGLCKICGYKNVVILNWRDFETQVDFSRS